MKKKTPTNLETKTIWNTYKEKLIALCIALVFLYIVQFLINLTEGEGRFESRVTILEPTVRSIINTTSPTVPEIHITIQQPDLKMEEETKSFKEKN